MTEEKKVIIDDVEYTESELSNAAKHIINQIGSLDQKIRSAELNIEQMQVGRLGYMDKLKDELENGQEDSSVST
jgi:TolA-binding protein